MSVKVENLTKLYGEQRAVDDVSFELKRGEVLGFLGPNGAGKTTTMKILSCFMPPSSGRAEVCGYDVVEASMEVRRRLGYLPEHNPLYPDMYVREYLTFVAGLHRIPNVKQRVGEMIELTGLERESHKPIGALSKGYRQRVGLAQAMLHDPEVLILDEPTSGLDPNQLVEIRGLIRKLGMEKTVIFSTHIMQEVQAVCDRVLIINKGKLVADDPIVTLQRRIAGDVMVQAVFREEIDPQGLEEIDGVRRVEETPEGSWRIFTDPDVDIRAEVFQFAVDRSLTLLELHRETHSVEDVFHLLTRENLGREPSAANV